MWLILCLLVCAANWATSQPLDQLLVTLDAQLARVEKLLPPLDQPPTKTTTTSSLSSPSTLSSTSQSRLVAARPALVGRGADVWSNALTLRALLRRVCAAPPRSPVPLALCGHAEPRIAAALRSLTAQNATAAARRDAGAALVRWRAALAPELVPLACDALAPPSLAARSRRVHAANLWRELQRYQQPRDAPLVAVLVRDSADLCPFRWDLPGSSVARW